MADFKYRWIPTSSFDIRRLEGWLEDMSEKGLILTAAAAGIGIFREETPQRRKCKILPADLFPAGEREVRLHLYERLGWECVVGLGGCFLVFLAAERSPGEIPDDEKAGLRKLRRKTGILFFSGLFAAVLFLGIWFRSLAGRNGFYAALLSGDAAGFFALTILFSAVIFWLGGRFFRVCRLCDSSGSLMVRKGDWRRAGRRRAAGWVFLLILLIGVLTAAGFQKGSLRAGNYAEEMDLPVLPLSVVAGKDGWKYAGRISEDGWQIDNSYTAFWRFLAPENYRVVQNGQREDGRAETLRAECKKAAFGWLAKGYYEECLAAYREEYGDPGELTEGGAAWFAASEEQILLLRAGRWVVLYQYVGASDLRDFVSEAVFRLE